VEEKHPNKVVSALVPAFLSARVFLRARCTYILPKCMMEYMLAAKDPLSHLRR